MLEVYGQLLVEIDLNALVSLDLIPFDGKVFTFFLSLSLSISPRVSEIVGINDQSHSMS
jgi:hypothetical protein